LTVTDEEIKEQFIIFQTIASLRHCICTGKGRMGGGRIFFTDNSIFYRKENTAII